MSEASGARCRAILLLVARVRKEVEECQDHLGGDIPRQKTPAPVTLEKFDELPQVLSVRVDGGRAHAPLRLDVVDETLCRPSHGHPLGFQRWFIQPL